MHALILAHSCIKKVTNSRQVLLDGGDDGADQVWCRMEGGVIFDAVEKNEGHFHVHNEVILFLIVVILVLFTFIVLTGGFLRSQAHGDIDGGITFLVLEYRDVD